MPKVLGDTLQYCRVFLYSACLRQAAVEMSCSLSLHAKVHLRALKRLLCRGSVHSRAHKRLLCPNLVHSRAHKRVLCRGTGINSLLRHCLQGCFVALHMPRPPDMRGSIIIIINKVIKTTWAQGLVCLGFLLQCQCQCQCQWQWQNFHRATTTATTRGYIYICIYSAPSSQYFDVQKLSHCIFSYKSSS
jgi:hypothetical protein